MNSKDTFKNRPSVADAKDGIVAFFKSQRVLLASVKGSNGELPIIDTVDYFYVCGKHIAVCPPMSKVSKSINSGEEFSAFIQEGAGKGAKKFYACMKGSALENDESIINAVKEIHPMIEKMLSHGGKLLNLELRDAIISLSHEEVYSVDTNLTPYFAKFTPNGRERFENARKVLMTYGEREVIFNVVIENDTYYCLAKVDSNKMSHISAGGVCKIYDGKDNHFETVIKIETEKTDEIFQNLMSKNNSYFKTNENLTALSFKKPN